MFNKCSIKGEITMRNKPHKILLPVFLIAISFFIFPGCEDEESTPKHEYIIGKWEVIEIEGEKTNTRDVRAFKEDSTYKWFPAYGSNNPYSQKGKWGWETKAEMLKVTLGDTSRWEIERLTKDELHFKDEAGDVYNCEKL